MDRDSLLKFWNEAWDSGLWAAGWKASLEGLSPQQAAWKPPSAPGVGGTHHSIWQIVLHMVFWREANLRRLSTGNTPTDDEVQRLNFPEPNPAGAIEWEEARRRFAHTQERVAAVFSDPKTPIDRIFYLLPHDCYHFGQINLLRGMLGLKPIE